MMKKVLLFLVFAIVTLCGNAQFKLTPSAGLMTEDGPYTIMRTGTELENFNAAQKAVVAAIAGADIGELEYEKSFAVTVKYKNHAKLPGAMVATDWDLEYRLKVEAFENKIQISVIELGSMECRRKGELMLLIHPRMGGNNFFNVGNVHIFNSKGEIIKGKYGKRMVAIFEDIANNAVKDIERNL